MVFVPQANEVSDPQAPEKSSILIPEDLRSEPTLLAMIVA
jgi:hypothetical protein